MTSIVFSDTIKEKTNGSVEIMSESIKKQDQSTQESYSPTTPKLLDMVAAAKNSENSQPVSDPVLIGWEVVKNEPCRFIGKTVYVRAGVSDDFCVMTMKQDWVFKELDGLNEYATDDIYDAALVHWDKYDDKNQLMGYTGGRFMKADTPVPQNMDYIDIPEGYIARIFVTGAVNACNMLREKINQQGIYRETHIWNAEVMPERIASVNGNAKIDVPFGYYIACELI